MYSFGNNEDGVLGVENNNLKSYNFIKVDFGQYNGKIKDIAAGTVHNIALTDDGKIFSWGSAQGGQLGLSEKYLSQKNLKNFCISTPTLVSIYSNIGEQTKITKISCGEAHTIVLNSKKEVYSWGFGSNGQLGLGFCEDSFEIGTGLSKSRIFTPKKIQTLQNKKIISIRNTRITSARSYQKFRCEMQRFYNSDKIRIFFGNEGRKNIMWGRPLYCDY